MEMANNGNTQNGMEKLVVLDDDHVNLEHLFPKEIVQAPFNGEIESEPPVQNDVEQDVSEQQVVKRSTREKRHPNYLKDYEGTLEKDIRGHNGSVYMYRQDQVRKIHL
ncbi:hypothetical protein AAC387_Pa12g1838 [Persea americana]